MKKTNKHLEVIIAIVASGAILFPAKQAFAVNFFKELSNSLEKIQKHIPKPRVPQSAPVPTPVTPDVTNPHRVIRNAAKAGKQEIPYEINYFGYSKNFLPIRNHIADGEMKLAYEAEQSNIKNNGTSFLNSVEAGVLSVDTAHTSDAIEDFAKAENHLKEQMDRSVIENTTMKYGRELISIVSGKGNLTEYNGEPYERIMMLNYKSIAYLLNGERKSYNVTRRAIDWQNIEKKTFEKGIEEVQGKVNEQKKAQSNEKTMSYAPKAFDLIFRQYNRNKARATSVKSAYINPFGFYMAGIVQEFDSYEDQSLRDNARISYKKALELNPKSKVIKKAVRATKKKPPRNKHLVHVIVADGFAPEKKTLSFNLEVAGGLVAVKTPLFEPVESSVKTIKIKSGKRLLATLSPIADIEAITLRHQLDMLPVEHAKVIASIGRNIGENLFWNQMGSIGMVGKLFRESIANPDMRSWMSLPKKISAARLYVSKKLKKITIVSYDKRGRVLAKQDVTLNKKSHSFIYARSLEKSIHAQVNKKLWI
ncbi:MAG: hypothetical protein KAH20_16435 [Methylococcales bacterium]|nr:hypothetical protein [Methylococcales bacterium]